MKKILYLSVLALVLASCQKEVQDEPQAGLPSGNVLTDLGIIESMGFDTSNVIDKGEVYIVEGDIVIDKADLPYYGRDVQTRQTYYTGRKVSSAKQRDILVKIDPSATSWSQGIQNAVQAWNEIGCNIGMRLTTGSSYDILVSSKPGSYFSDPASTVAHAIPPSPSGNPGSYLEINRDFSGYSTYTAEQQTYTIVHELGHTIGFAHQNGSENYATEEVPDTGPEYASVMYSHSGGRSWNRNRTDGWFTHDDAVAAHYLYTPSVTVNNVYPVNPWYLEAGVFNDFTLSGPSTYMEEILWDIPSGVEFAYSNNKKTVSLKFRSEGVYEIKYAFFIYPLGVTHWRTFQVQVFSGLYNDCWQVRNVTKSGNWLHYDLLYKATRDLAVTDFYALSLYNGLYDSSWSTWQWEYSSSHQRYYPPVLENIFGRDWNNYGQLYMLCESGTTFGKSFRSGAIYVQKERHHPIRYDKEVSDIEYIVLYIKDHLGRMYEEPLYLWE